MLIFQLLVRIVAAVAGSSAISRVRAQAAGALTINTPTSLISCQPASLTWSGAQPPVYLYAYKAGDLADAPLRQFPQQNNAQGSYTWNVDLPSGEGVTLQIRDATGQTQASAPVNIIKAADGKECNSGESPPPSGSGGSGSGSGSSGGASGGGGSSHSSTANTTSSTTGTAGPSSPGASNKTSPGSAPTTSSPTSGAATNTSSTLPTSSTSTSSKKNSAGAAAQPAVSTILLAAVFGAALFIGRI